MARLEEVTTVMPKLVSCISSSITATAVGSSMATVSVRPTWAMGRTEWRRA